GRGGHQLHDRSRHGAEAPLGRGLRRPVARGAQRLGGEHGQEPAHRDHAGAEPRRPAADRRRAQGRCPRRAGRAVVLALLARFVALATRTARGKRLLWRSWYQFLAARYPDPRWTFMNYGYRAPED